MREKNLYCNFPKLNLIKKHGRWEKGKGLVRWEFFDGGYVRIRLSTFVSDFQLWLKVAKALLGLGAGQVWLELKVES